MLSGLEKRREIQKKSEIQKKRTRKIKRDRVEKKPSRRLYFCSSSGGGSSYRAYDALA